MEGSGIIFALICGAVTLVGAVNIAYNIFKMTEIDAKARGFKNPKLWGALAMGGNNSGGLILYLIRRRNYPLINMSEEGQREIESRKKKVGIGIIFLVLGTIGLIICTTILQ